MGKNTNPIIHQNTNVYVWPWVSPLTLLLVHSNPAEPLPLSLLPTQIQRTTWLTSHPSNCSLLSWFSAFWNKMQNEVCWLKAWDWLYSCTRVSMIPLLAHHLCLVAWPARPACQGRKKTPKLLQIKLDAALRASSFTYSKFLHLFL